METSREFVTNKYGISVVKACVSCMHKDFDKDNKRVCTKGYGKVDTQFLCKEHYEMAMGLQKAGMGNGHVKKKDYLIQYANNRGMMTQDEFRDFYRRKYGSIYMDGQ